MKSILICAAAFISIPVVANAQAAPASSAPAAPASAPAPVDINSSIEAIAATPAGKASLEKNMPDLLPHPAYDQFKGMTLKDLAPLSGGAITDEKIAVVEADLKAAAGKK